MSALLEVRDLRLQFGGVKAVDGLSFEVREGEILAVIGPNGAGKTSAFNCISGFYLPTSGSVVFDGKRIVREVPAPWHALRLVNLLQSFGFYRVLPSRVTKWGMARTFQNLRLFRELSVLENLQFLASVQGMPHREARARVEEVIVEYDFADRRNQLAGTMSGGQKQRLALAGAILHRPELLLLDEPTSAVDPESRRRFWDQLFQLADEGTTLLVSTHFMDEAERCHRLAILDRGRLVADGNTRDLMRELPYRVLLVETNQPREAQAQLQSLSGLAGCAQIGNALPRRFATVVGRSVIRHLSGAT